MAHPNKQNDLENPARGTADAWLEGAFELFLESGIDSVRILPLAKKLGQSRTSFYWFFQDREALLDALVGRWREKNTGSIVRQAGAYADSLQEAVLNVTDCWFDQAIFDARLEFAMRSWALQSAPIAAEIETADAQRIAAIADMFRRFGVVDLTADVCSRGLYLIQIGYISMQISEDTGTRMKRLPEYVRLLTQHPPLQKEMDRFHARHGYVPG
ncbi:TetR/AcrR family transcriptional regulator [Pantoea sp. Tr-811]|uniref:TetR/AcrR family transcriptional regulator n=1 Tax=Pantoea sp. Tr-811 TaxID=2608361 RepID=UPI0014235632|nr:TetR/AcrR family transcriptional regulator [Pantoea sp. Tr-811]NIF29025.1 TetR/AcrR family transcriptional regulator [Pantoea sp. Tr-811]